MKTIIFILLKIGEIFLLPVAYFALNLFGWFIATVIKYFSYGELFSQNPPTWEFNFTLFGIAISAFIYGIVLLCIYGLPEFLKWWIGSNKELSEKIVNYIKTKSKK